MSVLLISKQDQRYHFISYPLPFHPIQPQYIYNSPEFKPESCDKFNPPPIFTISALSTLLRFVIIHAVRFHSHRRFCYNSVEHSRLLFSTTVNRIKNPLEHCRFPLYELSNSFIYISKIMCKTLSPPTHYTQCTLNVERDYRKNAEGLLIRIAPHTLYLSEVMLKERTPVVKLSLLYYTEHDSYSKV